MKYNYVIPPLTENAPKVIDLYSGPGGTGLGCKAAGFRILAAVESDPNAATTYEVNLGIVVKRTDITQLPARALRGELRLGKKELDVLIGCPPCQGFTRMRNNDGAGDPRNKLIAQYLTYVEEFQPRIAIFENVPGLVRSKHGKVFYSELRSRLGELGYALVEKIIDVANYGIPQHRRRVIVIAGRDNEILPFPEATHANPSSGKVKNGLLRPWITVKDVIEEYPVLSQGEDGTANGTYPNHKAPKMGDKVMKFIKKVPIDGGSRTDVPQKEWLACHQFHEGHNDVYGRMSWGKPANTITSGCTNVSKGRFVHPTQNRALTCREAAALQSFPDNYVFYGADIPSQIGNAVPPYLALLLMKGLFQKIQAANPEQDMSNSSLRDIHYISGEKAGISIEKNQAASLPITPK